LFLNQIERQIKMATDKLFTVCGVSKLDGEYKVRFANDTMRIKVLSKHGHEDIRLADLEGEFTKLQAAEMLLGLEDFADATAQATITEYMEDNAPKTVKATPKATVKAVAPRAKAPAKAVKAVENEDAPF
jgi:hypothetical protein